MLLRCAVSVVLVTVNSVNNDDHYGDSNVPAFLANEDTDSNALITCQNVR